MVGGQTTRRSRKRTGLEGTCCVCRSACEGSVWLQESDSDGSRRFQGRPMFVVVAGVARASILRHYAVYYRHMASDSPLLSPPLFLFASPFGNSVFSRWEKSLT